jgi:hypothetical protein
MIQYSEISDKKDEVIVALWTHYPASLGPVGGHCAVLAELKRENRHEERVKPISQATVKHFFWPRGLRAMENSDAPPCAQHCWMMGITC